MSHTLTVFVSSASAIAVDNSVDIRGPLYNGTNLESILSTAGNIKMDGTNFAAFFYDLYDNISTETLSIVNGNGNIIKENGLVYSTTIKSIRFEYELWGYYQTIGFFGDEYIPIKPNDPSKLAKLLLDSHDEYTLKTGETLDLGQGYTLLAKQVDVDGQKVWLEFDKDGEYVDDQIVSVTGNNDGNWTCELDKILGEDYVKVLKVHLNQVVQGASDSIAQIDGIWLIDYANAFEIKYNAEFGDLNHVSIDRATLSITNDDTFTLTRDSEQEIGGLDNNTMYFKVADTSVDQLRYYPFVMRNIGNIT